jgi:CBS domain-containing protein
MQVKDVMTLEVEVINPSDTIEDAAAKMRALDVGPLPVCDGDQLKGMSPIATSPCARLQWARTRPRRPLPRP